MTGTGGEKGQGQGDREKRRETGRETGSEATLRRDWARLASERRLRRGETDAADAHCS